MKIKLYLFAFALVCCVQAVLAQGPIRTWTGQGDGQSWADGRNWNVTTCKYIDGDGHIIYQTSHIPPRSGEIVIFDNVGTLNLTQVPEGISCGATAYTDYSEIAGSCGGGWSFFSIQILNNSNINLSGTQIYAGGTAMANAGYSEGLRVQNSTLTCRALYGEYAANGSSQPLNMNTIYAENSTLTCTWFQSGFFPGGKTYFSNCTINCPNFGPYSNNDYPNEKDEFVGCTINTKEVGFGPKCTAIATNCTFNLSGNSPAFALAGNSTPHSVTLNNVQINIDASAMRLWMPYQPGASVINGNINCNSTDPNFQIAISNSSNSGNSFPLLLNGNLTMNNGSIYVSNKGVLEITGNLEMTGTPDPNLTKDVVINNQTAFQIGGLSNYVNYNSGPYGPVAGGSPFAIKFSGSGDSHIKWPIGFPVDTLIIEKTGCGKVYFDNAPLHVTGKLQVNSGQLVLAPHTGSDYALVNGGDLVVKNGGSILVQPDAAIALGGNFTDENTTNNPATCNGFNNSATNTVAFYNTIYTPVNRIMGSANTTSIGNITLINKNTEPFTLANNMVATNIDMGTKGKIVLGNFDFILNGLISNYDNTRYFITNGAGSLQLKNGANSPVFFPVGSSDLSYSPVTVINNGTPDDFKVRVQDGLFDNGTSGNLITEKAVNSTWFINEGSAGGSDASISLQWSASHELSKFYRNNTHLIHYTGNQWDFGSVQSISGNNPYTITRNNITSFSPFGVMNDLNASEYDPNDVAILKAIRDNAPDDSPLKTEWADEGQMGTWKGVTWDNFSPIKVMDLDLSYKKLTSLDVSGLSSLQSLLCGQNQLTSLIVNGLANLKTLVCTNNQISSLNTLGLSDLENLDCSGNLIGSLDLAGQANLMQLSCSHNILTSLMMSGLAKLSNVQCSNNQLTSLDLTGLSSLTSLDCSYNPLKSLNVSSLSNLENLVCYHAQLSSLVVNGATKLTGLACQDNQLTSLDVSGLNLLTIITTADNNIPFSQMPLPNSSYINYGYDPQNKVFEAKEIQLGQEIDYSSEAIIDGTATVFSWYNDYVLIVGTDQSGKYTPTESGNFFCEMTNDKFPGLTLITNTVKVLASAPLYDLNDLAVLKTIRDNAPSDSPLKTEWADESQVGTWVGVTWDTSSPKRVLELHVALKNLANLDVTGLTSLQTLYSDSNQLTSLNVSGLTNLITLDCNINQLSSLDLSGLGNLQNFYCSNNNLSSLNLTGLTSLQSLVCNTNQLTLLNISGLTNLLVLVCDQNKLTSLDLSGLTKIIQIYAIGNYIPFSMMPLPNSAYFQYAYSPQNKIFEAKEIQLGQGIDYSSEASIEGMATVFSWFKNDVLISGTDQSGKYTPTESGDYHCEMTNAKFTGLTLTTNSVIVLTATPEFDPNDVAILKAIRDNAPTNSQLKIAWADESQLGTWAGLKWNDSSPKKVRELKVQGCYLASLNVTGLTKLENLYCNNNPLTSLNVSGLTNLLRIDCYENQLTSLDLSGLPNLHYLYCTDNILTSLNISGLTNLLSLDCSNNKLKTLNVNGLTNLYRLNCDNNQISSLDLSGLTYLQVVQCNKNLITELNISGLTNLMSLFCETNQLISMDLTSLINLNFLYCATNQLTSLNVSGLTHLELLQCSFNQLFTLDLSGLTELNGLVCNNNLLTSLNVSDATMLTYIACNDNLLTSVDVSGLNKLNYLTTFNNNILLHLMPLPNPSYSQYFYTPQNKVFEIKEIQLGQGIDYSSEATIDGTATAFKWFKNGNEIAGTDQSGKYAPTESGDFYCEMTNTKFPGLTLTSNTVTLKNTSCPQHFHTVWEGTSGNEHMTINVVNAKLDGADLVPGDEVGIFDNNLCVGFGKVTQTADNQHLLTITVSKDGGSGNGFTSGNEVSYILWDCSSSTEFPVQKIQCFDNTITPVLCSPFSVAATAFVSLEAFTLETQRIALNAGWNIISLRVIPNNHNLKNILQSLITEGKLKKVMDEEGAVIEDWGYFGGWQNTIGDLKNTEGYKINVISPTTLEVTGIPAYFPFDIPLNVGWNIISWPSPNEQNAKDVFQTLINEGKLKKVMDETGAVIEDWGYFGGWLNTIGNMKPGEGYKVNVTAACTLTINETGTKSEEVFPELISSAHFILDYKSNGTDHMNINLVNLAESGIIEGDEIGIFDGNICVGSAQIPNLQSSIVNQNSIGIPVSAADGIESKIGYSEGNPITLKLFRNGKEYPLVLQPLNQGKIVFEKGSSLFAQVDLTTGLEGIDGFKMAEINCYPNPFSDKVNIDINLAAEAQVQVEVFNQLGQRVKMITTKQLLPEGFHNSEWNGKNTDNQHVSPGIYYLRVNIDGIWINKKLVYSN